MLEKIFRKHYSKKYSYVLDAIFLFFSIEIILFLNNSSMIIRSNSDKVIFILICLVSITIFKGYVMLLRFTTFIDIGKIASGLLIAVLLYAMYLNANTRSHYNYLILLFYISLSFLSLYRLITRILYSNISKENKLINTLLFGAGVNGLMIKKALDDSNTTLISGFIDDDKTKIGRSIEGKKVFSLDKKLEKFVTENRIKQVIISTDKLKQKRKKELFDFFKNKSVKIFNLPSIDKYASSKGILGNLKPIIIEDLLKRDAIKINVKKNKSQYEQKIILITGAAGSIGSEIVRQLINYIPKKLILVDNSELSLFNIKNELSELNINIKVDYLLKSVTDNHSIDKVFKNNKIDIVFHAAAFKNVFMTESSPSDSILNNIMGTKNVLDNAIKYDVTNFVLVSTDKAVNPSNVMGASKRIAEIYASILSDKSKTKIITTRFGNVLGSSGSVVPIFKKQILNGGPVTITDPDITRYFMTITEACQLVLEAGAIGKGGEIYVFDMGDPVKIYDLAVNMIRLSGFIENEDIKIKYTGVRPGEKLFEELLTENENLKKSHHELIYIAKKEKFKNSIDEINNLIEVSKKSEVKANELIILMKKIVPEYIPKNKDYFNLLK